MTQAGPSTPGALDQGVGRSFAALGLGETVARLIAFAATVILARRLGAAAYGVVALAGAVLLYLQHLTDFGIDTVGVRRVAREPGSVERLVPSVLVVRTLIGFGLAVITGLAGLLLLPQPDGAILAGSAALLLARGANPKWVLVGLQRPGAVAVARAAGELLTALLVVTLVHDAGDLARVPAAQVAGDMIAALLAVFALRRLGFRLPAVWRPDESGPLFREARPLVVHAVVGLLVFNFDLIALRFLRDATSVGLYATAYALVAFLTNLGVAFGFSLLPSVSREGDGARARILYGSALAHAFAFTLPLAVGGALVAGELISLVFGATFSAAASPLIILLWTVPAVWLRVVGQTVLVARGRQATVLRITAISAVITISLDLLLIPRYGLTGAAAASVAAEVMRAALSLAAAAREGFRLAGPSRWWRGVVGALVMAGVVSRLDLPVLALVGIGAAVYGAVMVATGAVSVAQGKLQLRL